MSSFGVFVCIGLLADVIDCHSVTQTAEGCRKLKWSPLLSLQKAAFFGHRLQQKNVGLIEDLFGTECGELRFCRSGGFGLNVALV